jgi:hypothetical protein
VGARYMPTFHEVKFSTSGGETVTGTVRVSHGVGALLGFNFTNNIGLQAEVNYYQLQQKYTDKALERQVDLSYLNFPVLLSLNTNKMGRFNWNFVAGPQFGLNVGSELKTTEGRDSETLKATVAVKKGDVGLAYGTGFQIGINPASTLKADLGFRGFYGLVSVRDNVESGAYNVLIKASRKTYAGYLGLSYCF